MNDKHTPKPRGMRAFLARLFGRGPAQEARPSPMVTGRAPGQLGHVTTSRPASVAAPSRVLHSPSPTVGVLPVDGVSPYLAAALIATQERQDDACAPCADRHEQASPEAACVADTAAQEPNQLDACQIEDRRDTFDAPSYDPAPSCDSSSPGGWE